MMRQHGIHPTRCCLRGPDPQEIRPSGSLAQITPPSLAALQWQSAWSRLACGSKDPHFAGGWMLYESRSYPRAAMTGSAMSSIVRSSSFESRSRLF